MLPGEEYIIKVLFDEIARQSNSIHLYIPSTKTFSEQRVHHEEAEEQHRSAEVEGEGQAPLPQLAGMFS